MNSRMLNNLALASLAFACLLGSNGFAQDRPAPATKTIGPRSLYPAEYDFEIRVDVARLDELGLLAEVQRSVASAVLAEFRSTFGFPMDELTALTYVRRRFLDRPEEDWQGGVSPHALWVFEGSDRVGLVEDRGTLAGVSASVIAGTTCVFDQGEGFIAPRPGLLFYVESGADSETWLPPILRGEQRGGVAVATLTELTTIRNALAVVVAIAPTGPQSGYILLPGLPDDALTPEDPVLASRIALLEPEDESISIEVRLRFARGTVGPDRLARALTKYRDEVVKAVELRTVANLLREIRITASGADVVASLDLGSGRAATANLTRLVLSAVKALVMGRAMPPPEVEIVEVEVEVPEQKKHEHHEPTPQPLPKKRDGD
ncbi:MAG: hypothetical protein AB7I19_19105 [Planctomycetota bacterium]